MATKKLAKPVPRITAWSFSRLQDYRSCPRKAKFKHVDKLKEPGNDAMQRGSAIDQMESDYIQGKIKICPPDLLSFKAEFDELRKRKAVCQEQWCFTAQWTETGWFDQDAWCRIKTDIYTHTLKTNTLLVVDCKTGKPREYHKEQVKLYALGGLVKFPTVEAVDARLWYTDQGLEIPEEPEIYTRDNLKELIAYWAEETRAMLADTRFAPKPSNNCRWCHFSKSKGGECEY